MAADLVSSAYNKQFMQGSITRALPKCQLHIWKFVSLNFTIWQMNNTMQQDHRLDVRDYEERIDMKRKFQNSNTTIIIDNNGNWYSDRKKGTLIE
jgi:transposase-like protein